jgi:hypothetical protein
MSEESSRFLGVQSDLEKTALKNNRHTHRANIKVLAHETQGLSYTRRAPI